MRMLVSILAVVGSLTVLAPRATPGNEQWQRISGVVQSIQGDEVTVRTDDGRTVVVDISQARSNVRGQPTIGTRVSATGVMASPTRLQARAIRDFRAGNVQPDASGAARMVPGPPPSASPR